ncbi:MAG: Gramicidin S synthase 2 [Firmicutes bacterium ADurb.Bin419]|nr:MAG: Gramicidin S synthase 2 [Firmicutes bacterium ADurb.Bin419]
MGSPIAGRSHSDLENIIGMFVNALPMRNRIEADKSFLEILASVRENSLKAFENQDYQFEMLVEKLNVEVKPGRNPLYDVGFVLQNMKMPEMKVNGMRFIPYRDESKISKSDLTILATEEGEVISLVFEYCTSLFKKETIERLSKDYLKILRIATSERDIKIKDIELLDSAEKNKMISEIHNVEEIFEKLLDEDFGVI